MSEGSHRLLVVIVNYRSAALTLAALRSLAPEVADLPGTRVVVVDNHGGDDDAEVLCSGIADLGFKPWCELMALEQNAGFASGNNAALRRALASDAPAEYFLLLNPDTVVCPGALRALWEFAEAHPEAGIAGSQLLTPEGKLASCAFRFPSLLSELETGLRLGVVSRALAPYRTTIPLTGQVVPADWVSGASLLIRRAVLEQVGLLDEDYFLYFEEVDFCLRAARQGWRCYHVPASRVVHHEGQSTGVSDPNRGRRRVPGYWFKSRHRYFAKNHSVTYAAAADLLRLVAEVGYRLRSALMLRPVGTPRLFEWDLLRHVVSDRRSGRAGPGNT